MKKKVLIIGVVLMLVLAACAPAQPEVEVAEPAVVEESMDSEMEESDSESEAMQAESDDAPADDAEAEDAEAEMEATSEVSFSADVWPIIEEYALDAHGGKGGIFLENYDDIVAQVEPGNPENSMLYKVLIGDGAPQMPPGNPLPEETIQVIYDWIAQGAKNN